MKLSGNTVLITGGDAGFGLELAKLLTQANNLVIIAGRNKAKMIQATRGLKNCRVIRCNVTSSGDVRRLVDRIKHVYGSVNVLVNNAGIYDRVVIDRLFEKAKKEMLAGYLAAVRLIERLFPLLAQKEEAAIINVNPRMAVATAATVPTSSASEAALHAFTQTLRLNLATTAPGVKVFEVMPMMVNTNFRSRHGKERNFETALAQAIVDALKSDTYELNVGRSASMVDFYQQSPQTVVKALNDRRHVTTVAV